MVIISNKKMLKKKLSLLSDMPEFYKAFNVKPGDPMYRADSLRVKIW